MHVCLLFCLAGTAASQNNRKLLSLKVGQFINWSVEGGYGKYLHHLLWNNYFVLVFISKSEETLSPESTTSCKLSMHRCWMHISIQNITGEVLLKHHYFSHTIFLAWGGIKHTDCLLLLTGQIYLAGFVSDVSCTVTPIHFHLCSFMTLPPGGSSGMVLDINRLGHWPRLGSLWLDCQQ